MSKDRKRHWPSILSLPFAGLVVIVTFYCFFCCSNDDVEHRRPESANVLSSLGAALKLYHLDMGCFPYDSRGAEYALYQLKPFIGDATYMFFDSPSAKEDVASYDDILGRVINCDYIYANPSPFVPLEKGMMLAWEKSPSYGTKRCVLRYNPPSETRVVLEEVQ